MVQRVLPGLGLVFRLPSSSGEQAAAPPAAGFAHISALSDTRVEKIEKVHAVNPYRQLSGPVGTVQMSCIVCMIWHDVPKSASRPHSVPKSASATPHAGKFHKRQLHGYMVCPPLPQTLMSGSPHNAGVQGGAARSGEGHRGAPH